MIKTISSTTIHKANTHFILAKEIVLNKFLSLEARMLYVLIEAYNGNVSLAANHISEDILETSIAQLMAIGYLEQE